MRTLTALIATLALSVPLAAADPAQAIARHHEPAVAPLPPATTAIPASEPLIQVALLLDDSGSMQGLINQARSQLWELVGLLGKAQHRGRQARLQVALYHYGDLPALASPLVAMTGDLDAVSEQLFAINGGGGTEACGLVIQQAVQQLAWRPGADTLRLIVIAGNEEFTQGPVPWASAVGAARERGVVVHTIHCGDRATGVAGSWQAAAGMGGGTFTCIDHNASAAVPSPYDDELAALNSQLNRTYLAYGAAGAACMERQQVQDANAAQVGGLAARAAAKGTANYCNESWDLVDAVAKGTVDLAAAPAAQLPAEIAALPEAERAAAVAAKAQERTTIQLRIAELGRQRTDWLAAQPAAAATLGSGLASAVAAQAADAGFTIAK